MKRSEFQKLNKPCVECEVCSRIFVDDDGTDETPNFNERWTQEDTLIIGEPTHWQCPNCNAWNER